MRRTPLGGVVELSITTDYVTNRGNPEPYLRRIGRSKFTPIHWCHEWNTDHHYSSKEIAQIALMNSSLTPKQPPSQSHSKTCLQMISKRSVCSSPNIRRAFSVSAMIPGMATSVATDWRTSPSTASVFWRFTCMTTTAAAINSNCPSQDRFLGWSVPACWLLRLIRVV